jgi:hypothetical protein
MRYIEGMNGVRLVPSFVNIELFQSVIPTLKVEKSSLKMFKIFGGENLPSRTSAYLILI